MPEHELIHVVKLCELHPLHLLLPLPLLRSKAEGLIERRWVRAILVQVGVRHLLLLLPDHPMDKTLILLDSSYLSNAVILKHPGELLLGKHSIP